VRGIIKSLLSVRNPDATKCGVGYHEGISDALVYISYLAMKGQKLKEFISVYQIHTNIQQFIEGKISSVEILHHFVMEFAVYIRKKCIMRE